jgi:hypothetical protein
MDKTTIGAATPDPAVSTGPQGRKKMSGRRSAEGAAELAAFGALSGGAALALAAPASASSFVALTTVQNPISGQCLDYLP